MKRHAAQISPVNLLAPGVGPGVNELRRVPWVQAVHVLLDCNRLDHVVLVDVGGDGELHEDAVDERVGV